MNANSENKTEKIAYWYKVALSLAVITIIYNIVEGVVCSILGYEDKTLALFGFGMDSFVEVISGLAIWRMIYSQRKGSRESKDDAEKIALKIVGYTFYFLAFGLMLTAGMSFLEQHQPESTFWGIVVSVISILTMCVLIYGKIKAGNALNSQAIIADANCTRACMLLSFILFLSSIAYELWEIGMIDSIGAGIIALYAAKEGRESINKSKGIKCCSKS